MYKFAPACEYESIVFGACKPGYSDRQINDWLDFMKGQNIKRICCLLDEKQLNRYSNLLERYRQEFGCDRVCWTPIKDFQLCEVEMLTKDILPFLIEAELSKEKVLVHCSGGIGRTGQILAAWLVNRRGFSNKDAIAAVKKMGRNPHEAVIYAAITGKNPFKVLESFNTLLDRCRFIQ
jgi:protein-tyrosine phosphatase